jgi:ATP-dependent Clp protease adaptor protein ClpS
MATAAPPRAKPRSTESRPGADRDRPWLVIVRNDDHNTFEGVAFALSRTLPGVTYERGLAIADRIHNTGRATVWSGHREQAELYWEQLANFGLTMAPLTPAA